MTDDPIDRLRQAIDSGDPDRVAACSTDDYTAVFPLRPADDFAGADRVPRNRAAVFAGPVVMTVRDGRIDWARSHLGPVAAAGRAG